MFGGIIGGIIALCFTPSPLIVFGSIGISFLVTKAIIDLLIRIPEERDIEKIEKARALISNAVRKKNHPRKSRGIINKFR